ncbi:hypothetical protein KUTeg_010944 [Tegillarca granosa]|uniref:Uncharacterized protein n=1 Tax=Tegillarca granosa TaxID=220873 RepID=A0ABQ9F2F7_TEGGR|nr:hypothetical protein KUTeg_010944 [Tegillarca granosa]
MIKILLSLALSRVLLISSAPNKIPRAESLNILDICPQSVSTKQYEDSIAIQIAYVKRDASLTGSFVDTTWFVDGLPISLLDEDFTTLDVTKDRKQFFELHGVNKSLPELKRHDISLEIELKKNFRDSNLKLHYNSTFIKMKLNSKKLRIDEKQPIGQVQYSFSPMASDDNVKYEVLFNIEENNRILSVATIIAGYIGIDLNNSQVHMTAAGSQYSDQRLKLTDINNRLARPRAVAKLSADVKNFRGQYSIGIKIANSAEVLNEMSVNLDLTDRIYDAYPLFSLNTVFIYNPYGSSYDIKISFAKPAVLPCFAMGFPITSLNIVKLLPDGRTVETPFRTYTSSSLYVKKVYKMIPHPTKEMAGTYLCESAAGYVGKKAYARKRFNVVFDNGAVFDRTATKVTVEKGMVRLTVKADGIPIPTIRCHKNTIKGRVIPGRNVSGPASSSSVIHDVSFHANSEYISTVYCETTNFSGNSDWIKIDTSDAYM